MPHTESDIHALFCEIRASNKMAFDRLFRLFYPKLLRFAYHYVKCIEQNEEIVSDVFVWLWTNRQNLNSISSPEQYLFTAVKNRCLNTLRSSAKTVSLDVTLEKTLTNYDNQLAKMEQSELTEKLNAIINNLPKQQRLVFRMIKENGLTTKQVADILNIAPRTVETHLYKAIKQLKQEISLYLGYSPKEKQFNKLLTLLY